MPFLEGGIVPMPVEEIHEDLRDRLLTLQPAGVRVLHRLEDGNPATEILHLAKKMNIDLIVMGTHGRRGLTRLLMGSVAEKVGRQASCPVLTVRTPIADHDTGTESGRATAKPAWDIHSRDGRSTDPPDPLQV
jgi:K+-sensing histidine kinase KdpD